MRETVESKLDGTSKFERGVQFEERPHPEYQGPQGPTPISLAYKSILFP